jgi:putative transposase
MPRQLRLEYEGAVYHVMARGDRREAIYHDDRDRLAWVDYLNQVCRRTEWRVYGWVLMGNHYHLLVETPRANLVSGMQWLQTAYTVWFNRRHNLSGHLFGGRYKAVLIDKGEPQGKMLYGYVGTVLDYLHLNPVRAGIVGGRSGKSLVDYRGAA